MVGPDEIAAFLRESLADHRLSRSERQGLAERFEEALAYTDLPTLRREALSAARAAIGDVSDASAREVFDWLEAVFRVIENVGAGGAVSRDAAVMEAHFSPGDTCRGRIAQLIQNARKTLDVCVFTITDDRISEPLLDAHRRGVALRVITDDDKADDEGSDVARLARAGVPVRVDRTEYHMHHKFALFDDEVLLTGSYNWTRGAAQYNDENLIVTDEPRLVHPFRGTFERIWNRLE
ncbi:MAG: phospholipase D-like domain-containing protein [Isosphaeraceae bacterium]